MKASIAPAVPATLAVVLALAPFTSSPRRIVTPDGLGAAQRVVTPSIPATGDEFVGPFASWSRVTTDYGAVGDGVADDTGAIQRALDDLGRHGRSPVLFLPAGTYRITRTLSIRFAEFLSIVGEDPAATVLRWDGPAGGTMLVVNGLAYSRIVRVTFDGRRRADVAVEQSWDASAPHFDTGNEYADDRFVDVAYGIRGGFRGHGFAETSVLRSRFVRNTTAGISLGNFNALNLWVWYSSFVDCAIGVTNETGAGNFHVYNSIFQRSTSSDLSMNHTGGFSARGNYSEGSRAFFVSRGTTANPATIHLQRNTIVEPKDAAVIRLGNQGPGVLLDNTIQSPPEAAGPVVTWDAWFGGDVTSVGNTFSTAHPIQSNGRLTSVDDRVVARADARGDAPTESDPLPHLRRQVFDVRPNAGGRAVQAAIDAASARRGARPIVHVPAGVYDVSETLTIPPSAVQLVGDGYATVLRWSGRGSGPVVRLQGPSRATLREIQIDGAGRANGLVVDDADQPDGRVFMQQVQLRHASEADLIVDGLDFTHVELEDFGHAYSPHGTAIRVTGGPRRSAGEASPGRVSIFSGASSGNRVSYDVSNGGRLLVRDLWYESGVGAGFARVTGRAEFTADGLRVSSPVGDEPSAFAIDSLDGRVTILASHLDDGIRVTGSGRLAGLLALGLYCEERLAHCYQDASRPSARGVVLNSRQAGPVPVVRSLPATDIGTADADFLRTMLRHAREERPTVLTARPASATDVRIFRVLVQRGVENVRLSSAR